MATAEVELAGGAVPTGLVLVSGTAHPGLADDIARIAGLSQVPVQIDRYPDGELTVRLLEPVRGRCAVIVQPLGPPVDAHLVELLALADACRRAAAARIVAVVPYLGYARGDRRHGRREPIMASLVARLIDTAGVTHLVAVDLHAPQIEGFYRIPVDDLSPFATLVEAVRDGLAPDAVVVSPDLGRLAFATRVADELHTDVAVVHKRRLDGAETQAVQVIGDVRDRPCLIVDDMITTGSTIASSVQALLRAGARPDVVVAATHGLFVRGADERLRLPAIRAVYVTDTLPQSDGNRSVVSIAPLIAGAVRRLGP